MRTKAKIVVVACAVLGLGTFVVLQSSGAQAETRPATVEELSPPPGALQRLEADLGVKFSMLDEAQVDIEALEHAAAIASESEYSSQIGDVLPERYLLHMDQGPDTGIAEATAGQDVWVLHYSGLDIKSGSPMTDSGAPAEAATIGNAYIIADSLDGEFILAHWTD